MRVIGDRVVATYGLRCPGPDEVEAVAQSARLAPHHLPAGVYRHRSHAAANAQADAWDVEAVVRRQQGIRAVASGDRPPVGPPLAMPSRLGVFGVFARMRRRLDHPAGVRMSPAAGLADWECVSRLATAFGRRGVDHVLVGGYALGLNGVRGRVDDVDVLVSDALGDSLAWTEALCDLFPALTRELRDWEGSPFASVEGEGPGPVRVVGYFPVDVVSRIGGLSLFGLRPYARTVEWDGVPLRVLDLAGLRLTKAGGRDRDAADLDAIDVAARALGDVPMGLAEVDGGGRVVRRTGARRPAAHVRPRSSG